MIRQQLNLGRKLDHDLLRRTASCSHRSDRDARPHFAQMHLATTTEPALWIVDRLHPFVQDVGSIVPPGFEAYARVFHPPYRVAPDGTMTPVRWRDIAAANERSLQVEMRRLEISCAPSQFSRQRERLWDQQPHCGRLPSEIADRLVTVLGRHTSTPESCWFAVWEGFGDLRVRDNPGSKFSIPGRTLILLHGHVGDLVQTLSSVDWIYLSPNLWWPEDRAWCVATEIDFTWTYVGGAPECIQQVMDDPELEAVPTNPAEGNCMEK